jgi:hypothetical protein
MEHKWYKTMAPAGNNEFFKSWRFWRPALAVLVGAIGGFLYFYFSHCKAADCVLTGQTVQNVVLGAAMGYFVVNSPCSRGRC